MNFIEEAIKTKSPNFYSEKVSELFWEDVSQSFIQYGESLDDIKKTLFYGKIDFTEGSIPNLNTKVGHLDEDIVHGILGVATEGVELVQALAKSMQSGEEIDLVNIKEEMGDVFWYLAILANRLGVSFEDVQETVIKKLRHRFPDKFSNEKANDRDLDGERQILENGK